MNEPFRIFHLAMSWRFLKELFPAHSAFRLFEKRKAGNTNLGKNFTQASKLQNYLSDMWYLLFKNQLRDLAKLFTLPESCNDINSIVNSLLKQKLYTKSSSSCPIAQNAFNPFISAGIKTEIPDPDAMN